MPNNNWIGGAAVATEIDTQTIALTWASADKIRTTLDSEDGTTQEFVETTVAGSDIETDVLDPHLANLQNETTKALFKDIDWTKSGTDKIVATAKVKGKPFYLAASETTAGDGTHTNAATTASSGPEDAGVGGNYSLGTVLAAGEDFRVMPNPNNRRSYNITYGLKQSGKDLKSLRRSPEYKGTIGDPANKFYFLVDVSNVGGGNVPYVTLNGRTGETWLKGTLDEVRVYSTSRSKNAVKLAGTIGVLRMKGPGVVGKVNVASGAALTTFFCLSCPNGEYEIDTLVTGFTNTKADSGNGIIRSGCTTITTVWQAILRHTAGAVGNWDNYNGAHVYYNGSDTLAQGDNYGGVFDFTENVSAEVTVTAFTNHAGLLLDKSALGNINWPTIQNPGGTVDIGEAGTVVV